MSSQPRMNRRVNKCWKPDLDLSTSILGPNPRQLQSCLRFLVRIRIPSTASPRGTREPSNSSR